MFNCLLTLAWALLFVGSSDGCDLYATAGTDFTVPLEDELQTGGRLIWKLGNVVKHYRNIKDVTSGNVEVLTKNGSYILKNVKKNQSMVYTSEIYDSYGKRKFIKEKHLCVLDPVSKPTVETECKESKVIFTCVLGQNQREDRQVRWICDGQSTDYTELTLEQEASETKTTKFSCQVFNRVSSKTSDALSHQCPVDIPSQRSSGPGKAAVFPGVVDIWLWLWLCMVEF